MLQANYKITKKGPPLDLLQYFVLNTIFQRMSTVYQQTYAAMLLKC